MRLKHRFGFDRRGLFTPGDAGAVVHNGAVAKQLTNQTLFIAFSVGGGNNVQSDDRGVHRLAKDFLRSGRQNERIRTFKIN